MVAIEPEDSSISNTTVGTGSNICAGISLKFQTHELISSSSSTDVAVQPFSIVVVKPGVTETCPVIVVDSSEAGAFEMSTVDGINPGISPSLPVLGNSGKSSSPQRLNIPSFSMCSCVIGPPVTELAIVSGSNCSAAMSKFQPHELDKMSSREESVEPCPVSLELGAVLFSVPVLVLQFPEVVVIEAALFAVVKASTEVVVEPPDGTEL